MSSTRTNLNAETSEANYYSEILDDTVETITRRARNYRNLVIFVASTFLIPVIWALVTLTITPLLLLILIPVACVVFWIIDEITMMRWKTRILESWAQGNVEISALRESVKGLVNLPQNTLVGMMDSLPSTGDIIHEKNKNITDRLEVRNTYKRLSRLKVRVLVNNLLLIFTALVFTTCLVVWPSFTLVSCMGTILALMYLYRRYINAQILRTP